MGVIKINKFQLSFMTGLICFIFGFFIGSGPVLAETPSATNEDSTPKTLVQLKNERFSLEAEQINYSGDDGSMEAVGGVILVDNKTGLRMETEQLIYNSGNGIVKVPGAAKITTNQAVFRLDSLTYDLKNETGYGGSLQGTVTGYVRDYQVTGTGIEFKDGVEIIFNPKVTRCLRPKPDYYFTAVQVKIESKKVRLANVLLYIKGIPVFYLPSLTLYTGNKDWDFPEIQIDYSEAKGLILEAKTTSPVKNRIDFHTNIYIETRGNSDVGAGFGYQFGRYFADQITISNDLKGTWKIKDELAYNTSDFLIVADGLKSVTGSSDERRLGLSATRKYWQGFGGSWRFKVLARYLAKFDNSGAEYGGTYAGYQLDYKPIDNLSFSVLRLDTYFGPGDYRDFEVYPGLNLLYNWTIPLSKSFSLNLSGANNMPGTYYLAGVKYPDLQYWVHQDYKISYNSCCWSFNLGWDDVAKSWSFGPTFKF
jgi:hypothetical protein